MHQHSRRWPAAIAVVLAAGFTLIAPAHALDGTSLQQGRGWGQMYDPAASSDFQAQAGSFVVDLAGTPVEVLCTDVNVPIDFSATYTTSPLSGPGAGRAVFLLGEHERIGTPATDPQDEIAALQIAVWNALQGAPINTDSVADATVLARATEIAAATGEVSVPTSINPELTLEVVDTDAGPTARVRLSGMDNLANRSVRIRSGDSQVRPSVNADGVAEVLLTEPGEVEAVMTVAMPLGLGLVNVDGSQPLVTMNPVTVVLTATASNGGGDDSTTAPWLTLLGVAAFVGVVGSGWRLWGRSR